VQRELERQLGVLTLNADWVCIDAALFRRERVEAIRLLRQMSGLSLREAIEAVVTRYQYLRLLYPGQFEHPEDSYWNGFTS
jgi:hypothetical protein